MQARKTIAVISFILCGAAPAFAQQQTPSAPTQEAPPAAPSQDIKAAIEAKFVELDADGSGGISKAEAAKLKGLPERFQSADKNKDGKLDKAEFTAVVGG